MEDELRSHLLSCATAFAGARGFTLSTVGRFAANDGAFFQRVSDGEGSFTARTYDKVIGWFHENWPDDLTWPADVPRPSPEAVRVSA